MNESLLGLPPLNSQNEEGPQEKVYAPTVIKKAKKRPAGLAVDAQLPRAIQPALPNLCQLPARQVQPAEPVPPPATSCATR